MAADKQMQRIVALDIGTNKIAAIVANVNAQGELEIIGIGTHQSRGLKKGVVVNIDSTVQSIQRAVEEAELMSGCEIDSVYAGIAGSHIRSLNSHGIVAIRDREVFALDIDRVIDAAKAMAIPADQKILHVLPQEYIIDAQEGVKEPLGMSGVRLEAKVHMVTCAVNAAQNIEKCIERCGLAVNDVILEQLASTRYSVTMSVIWAYAWSISEAARLTLRCSLKARSGTPRSYLLLAIRSPMTSQWRCVRRPRMLRT